MTTADFGLAAASAGAAGLLSYLSMSIPTGMEFLHLVGAVGAASGYMIGKDPAISNIRSNISRILIRLLAGVLTVVSLFS